MGNAGQQAVEQSGGELLGHAFALARTALGVHHLVAFTQLLVQFRNQLGRVLQVGIDDDHGGAGGRVEARRDGNLVAEVAA